jgi:hypothetical protein
MKPTLTAVRTRSTLDGAAQEMAIDAGAMAHIMSILTNLYADPIAAVVREYSTNAFDATVEAGSSEPVRVSLPTAMNPTFTVEDFGIGMSTDTILSHYSLYGRSDKRDSNNVVGMLGLGCKSALTYADMFTIASRRNGVETVAVVSKNEQGVGQIEIADTRSTTERNGTTISVPVKSYDVRKFSDAAEEIYSYWTRGTVLIDGKAPEDGFAGMTRAPGTEFYYKANAWGEGHYVVMGNVAYRVSSDILTDFRAFKVVIRANIGDVSFTPSREELMYDNRTKKFLRDALVGAKDSVTTHISAILATAGSKPEALRLYAENSGLSFLSNVKWAYNGASVPVQLRHQDAKTWRTNQYGSKAQKGMYLNTSSMGNPLFIRGYTKPSIGQSIKDCLDKWVLDPAHKFHTHDTVFFFDQSPEWHEWVEWVEWDDIKDDFPVVSVATGYRSAPQSRSGRFIDTAREVSASHTKAEDHPTKTYVPFTKAQMEADSFWTNHQHVYAVGWQPVLVYVREMESFCDTFTTKTMADVKAEVARIAAAISDDAYLAEAVSHSGRMSNLRSKAANVLDPDLRRVLECKGDSALNGITSVTARRQAAEKTVADLVKRYPVLEAYVGGYNSKPLDYIEIVNALYTYRKDNI